jgi:excisionase family DNA binding protein
VADRPVQPSNQFESVEAAARRLGVSSRTVRRMISRGEITGYRVGKRLLRVYPADVESAVHRIPTAGM